MSNVPGRPPVVADIVEEHFDDADFLWEHREDNIYTDDWSLHDLAQHEARAHAHLDGLRLAELSGTDLVRERLASGEFGAAMVATFVLADAHGMPWAQGDEVSVLAMAMRQADAAVVDGVRRALRHRPTLLDGLSTTLQELVLDEDPVRAACASDVLAFWRQKVDPRGVARLLESEVVIARTLGLATAQRTGALTANQLRAAIADAEPAVRAAAMHAGMALAIAELPAIVRDAALRNTDPDPVAVYAMGVLGQPQSEADLRSLLPRKDVRIAAVTAMGALGSVDAVGLLIDLMSDEDLGVHATAAYKRMTGATDVEGHKPLVAAAADDEGEEGEALPPDADKAQADWERRQKVMVSGPCYQCGVPIDGTLPAPFDHLPLSVRRDLWLRLRAQKAAVPMLELEALASQQRSPSQQRAQGAV